MHALEVYAGEMRLARVAAEEFGFTIDPFTIDSLATDAMLESVIFKVW